MQRLVSEGAAEIASFNPCLNVGSIIGDAGGHGDWIFHQVQRYWAQEMARDRQLRHAAAAAAASSSHPPGSPPASPRKHHHRKKLEEIKEKGLLFILDKDGVYM